MHRCLWLLLCVVVLACDKADEADTAVGTLEMVELDVGPLQPARALRVDVHEGDEVQAGDTLAVFMVPNMAATERQAESRLAAAEQAERELTRGARAGELARAEAELQMADADATRSAADLKRVEPLAARGDVSRAALDAAAAMARATSARRDMARASLALLREGPRTERRQAAAADVRGASAASAALRATAADLVLLSPTSGVVLSRNAEPGEVLAAGQSAVTLGQPGRPWARIYVSQYVVPSLRVGDSVTARLDRDTTTFRGRVASIASKAEFTPRVALTDQERADLLFGVKIEFVDSGSRLKAGLPITVSLPPRRP